MPRAAALLALALAACSSSSTTEETVDGAAPPAEAGPPVADAGDAADGWTNTLGLPCDRSACPPGDNQCGTGCADEPQCWGGPDAAPWGGRCTFRCASSAFVADCTALGGACVTFDAGADAAYYPFCLPK